MISPTSPAPAATPPSANRDWKLKSGFLNSTTPLAGLGVRALAEAGIEPSPSAPNAAAPPVITDARSRSRRPISVMGLLGVGIGGGQRDLDAFNRADQPEPADERSRLGSRLRHRAGDGLGLDPQLQVHFQVGHIRTVTARARCDVGATPEPVPELFRAK